MPYHEFFFFLQKKRFHRFLCWRLKCFISVCVERCVACWLLSGPRTRQTHHDLVRLCIFVSFTKTM